MKTLTLLAFCILSGLGLSAQNQSQLPKISQQITDYFSAAPREKVFILTDKVHYKPGETIWFRAFVTDANNQPIQMETGELFLKLYDKNGTLVIQDIFRLNNGSTGDLLLPENLRKDTYFLVAYTSVHHSPEEISCSPLKIDPEYSNSYLAETSVNDQIFLSGQKNEISLVLRDYSGDIRKNTSLRFQLMNGTEIIAKGKIKTDSNGKASIPLSIPEKTNGEPFICVISDAGEEWKQEVFLQTNLDPLVIRFFPEGGNLITGVPAKIGFTAFNKWGLPVDVEGSVVNQENKPITLVKSFTKGLGLFSVTSDENQKLNLKISGQTGQNQSFELPLPQSEGLALSVIKTDGEYLSANLIFADKQKHPIALTITQGSNLYWAADMDIDGIGRIKIPTENLPHGINLLAVFSQEGQLLAQRIVFQDKKQELQIEIQPEKNSLQTNKSMTIKVRLTDANNQALSGDLAVVVTDKYRSDREKPQINEYLLIGSELETPFSLISGVLKNKITNTPLMDAFLIANRLIGFEWEKILTFNPEKITSLNSGSKPLSGLVTDKNGNKMNKAKVSLVNNTSMRLHTTSTNAEGLFSFPDLSSIHAEDFTAKATDSEGKHELNIEFSKSFEDQISVFLADLGRNYSLINASRIIDPDYFKNNPDLFQKSPNPVKNSTLATDNQRRMLSTSTNILDVIKNIKPYRVMGNKIVFFGSENSLNAQGGALLVLDGQQMGTDISSIQNISPLEVDHINVSTNPMDIQRFTGLNSVGVIEIFMKKGPPIEKMAATETSTNKYDGIYRIPAAFPAKFKNDTRTTLLWIPQQKVDETGLFEFTLTAGKVISDFIIEVQGISDDGQVGKGSAEFSVTQ